MQYLWLINLAIVLTFTGMAIMDACERRWTKFWLNIFIVFINLVAVLTVPT